jgi:hypothetical protein
MLRPRLLPELRRQQPLRVLRGLLGHQLSARVRGLGFR